MKRPIKNHNLVVKIPPGNYALRRLTPDNDFPAGEEPDVLEENSAPKLARSGSDPDISHVEGTTCDNLNRFNKSFTNLTKRILAIRESNRDQPDTTSDGQNNNSSGEGNLNIAYTTYNMSHKILQKIFFTSIL